MSFVKRVIETTITLGKGSFGDTVGDTVKLTGLRTSVQQVASGQDAQGQMQAQIFGLPLEMMNRLTVVGTYMNEIRGQNRISISAGNDGEQLSLVYAGFIDQAWAEFNAQPDVALRISALGGLLYALKPIDPSSFKGTADARDIMAGLAQKMGLAFVGNDVSVKMQNCYFPGTALDQVKACARAANIRWDISRGKLEIWRMNSARAGDPIIMSPAAGLVGYPAFTSSGVTLTCVFTPNAVQGGKLTLRGSITPANGDWIIMTVTHHLESLTPGGQWFSVLDCARLNPL